MKQKRLLVALCAMALAAGAMAQQRERVNANGRTIDAKSGEPLANVDVTVMTADSTVVTAYPSWNIEGREGWFSFNLEWGTSYIFRFNKEGYDTVYVNRTYPPKSSALTISGIGNLGRVALKEITVNRNVSAQTESEEDAL